MQLILYPFIIFVCIFLTQLFFIIRNNKKSYKENKKHWKIAIKIIAALIISIIIGILSFYILGIYVLIGLNEGR